MELWLGILHTQKFGESLQQIFWANLSLIFRWLLVKFPLLWTRLCLHPAFCKTLQTVSSLRGGGIPAFTIILFTQKFPISYCKCLVCCDILLFCRKSRFGGLFWLFFGKSIIKVSSIIFHNPADGFFWMLLVWFDLWYFWISLSWILI